MNAMADALNEIADTWCADNSDMRKEENGFDWLPGSHTVRVRASSHPSGDLAWSDRICICVRTDYLRAVPIENADFVVNVGLMSKFLSSGYSLVYVPHEIRRKYGENKPAELYLFSSAYVDQNTAGWLPRFLAHMALMQPISAEIRATASPEFLGGKPAYASGEKSASISDILLAAETILVPAGKNDSKWIGSEEFRQFVTEYANSDACFGSGDDKGMTLETPCGGESAFISFRTDQRLVWPLTRLVSKQLV